MDLSVCFTNSYCFGMGTETEYRQTTDTIDSMLAGLTSRWGWYWVRGFPDPGRAPKCKTQNSGFRSNEEKPHDPISQSSRCNTQEGLLTGKRETRYQLLKVHQTIRQPHNLLNQRAQLWSLDWRLGSFLSLIYWLI